MPRGKKDRKANKGTVKSDTLDEVKSYRFPEPAIPTKLKPGETNSAKVKLCLNMIVTDEEHVIGQCLRNVGHLIDAIAIDFNGKGDKTPALIEAFAAERKIPLLIKRSQWIDDFGHSRTLALRAAEELVIKLTKEAVNETESKGPVSVEQWEKMLAKRYTTEVWYALFMDADNAIVALQDGKESKTKYQLDKQSLKEDCVLIDMGQSTVSYDYRWMVKLDLNGKRRWKWVNPIHEVVVPDGWAETSQRLSGGYMHSGRTGKRSADPVKYLKDAIVLERHLVNNPTDPRSWYYLGQSYRDAQKYRMAYEAFLARGTLRGWSDEDYVAWMEAGKLAGMLFPENPSKATIAFSMAHEVKPDRLEAIFQLVNRHYLDKTYRVGWLLGKGYLDCKIPEGGLFVDRHIYTWRFFDVMSVIAFQVGEVEQSKALVNKALASADLTGDDRKRVTANIEQFG